MIERRRSCVAAPGGTATVLFLDEIHRFNKAQQDALLPAVEEGWSPDRRDDRESGLRGQRRPALAYPRLRARAARRGGAGAGPRRAARARLSVDVEDGVLAFLARAAQGDARVAIAALELAARRRASRRGERSVRVERAADAMQRRAVRYDRAGDRHYDYISAWIKAVRGSDPDAVALLPGGDARGRRGPRLHRAPRW